MPGNVQVQGNYGRDVMSDRRVLQAAFMSSVEPDERAVFTFCAVLGPCPGGWLRVLPKVRHLGYCGVVLFEEYTALAAQKGSQGGINERIPIIESAADDAR